MTAPAPSGWTPASPCGPACLPDGPDVPLVGEWLSLWRTAAGAGLVLFAGPLVALTPLLGARVCRPCTRYWFLGVLRAFGVRLVVRGQDGAPSDSLSSTEPGTLVVANHVSWLDVVALQALRPMRMLAKAELRCWPVLGLLAARAGTLFIERGRLTGLRAAVDRIAGALTAGSVVGVFPEGTTWCGRSGGRHRPAVFQAALDSGARVQPVALRFRSGSGQPTTAAAFVGDATLLQSVRQVARARGLTVEVTVFPAIRAAGHRRDLAERCAAAIGSATGTVEKFWTSTTVQVAGSSRDDDTRQGRGRQGSTREERVRHGAQRDGEGSARGQRAVGSGAA